MTDGGTAQKRLILHIGTHKTGTSSFQRSLQNNAQSLIGAGIRPIRERVPAGPGWSRRRGQVRVKVDEHGAGQVTGIEIAPPLPGIREPPAHICDPQVRVAKARAQGFRVDEAHPRLPIGTLR